MNHRNAPGKATGTRARRAGRAALIGLLAGVPLFGAAPPGAGAAGTGNPFLRATSHATSQNWAGYAVTAESPFRRVLGSWSEPAPRCQRGSANYAAFWIGIGGFTQNARGLEQIGTDSDCGANGRANYYAWYEILPAPPVLIPLHVSPGDRLAASVTMNGNAASMHFRDLTTQRTFIRTVGVREPDTTSAEWIAEAPSSCTGNGFCRTLPLDDFGSVTFSDAQASTATGSLNAVDDPEFLATELELQDRGGSRNTPPGEQAASGSEGRATTSPLAEGGSSFSIFWEAPQASAARRGVGVATGGGVG